MPGKRQLMSAKTQPKLHRVSIVLEVETAHGFTNTRVMTTVYTLMYTGKTSTLASWLEAASCGALGGIPVVS